MENRTIVVKLGTSVLTGGFARLNRAHMVELVRQCAALHRHGHRVVLVTSGAIAAGREHLGHPPLAPTLPNKQMLAAVGQTQLIRVWQDLFNLYGLHIGQMLLTRADLEDRERYLNARDTLRTLLDHRIIPVINENDAVATAEIKVGDNDNLSARAAILADADLLVLLTDQKGLFTADPRTNPDAQLIEEVQTIDDTLRSLAGDSVSGLGTGGMATKLQAADVARRAGVDVVIATGQIPEVIGRTRRRGAGGDPVPGPGIPPGRAQELDPGRAPSSRRSAGGSGGRGRHAGEGLQPVAQGHRRGEGRFRAWRRGAYPGSQGERAGSRYLPLRPSGAGSAAGCPLGSD